MPARLAAQNPDTALVILRGMRLDSLRASRAITYFRRADAERSASLHHLHQGLAAFAREHVHSQLITRVAVLGRDDWDTLSPFAYAFPHNYGPPANLILSAADPPPLEGVDTLQAGELRDLLVLGHEGGHLFNWAVMPAAMRDSLRVPDERMSPALRARFARFDQMPGWYWEFTASFFAAAFIDSRHAGNSAALLAYFEALASQGPPRYRSLDAWSDSLMTARSDDGRPWLVSSDGRVNFGWYQGVAGLMAAHMLRGRMSEVLTHIRRVAAGDGPRTTLAILEQLERLAPGLIARMQNVGVAMPDGLASGAVQPLTAAPLRPGPR